MPPLGLDSWRSYSRSRRYLRSIGLPPITQTKLPAADFVAFRVPANPDDPAPRRLFLPPSRPRCGGFANQRQGNDHDRFRRFFEALSGPHEAIAEANVLNKAVVFDALAAGGVTRVTIEFDGE